MYLLGLDNVYEFRKEENILIDAQQEIVNYRACRLYNEFRPYVLPFVLAYSYYP
jgi:hypothetical protein